MSKWELEKMGRTKEKLAITGEREWKGEEKGNLNKINECKKGIEEGKGELKIGCWNIKGIKKKIMDKDFKQYICNFKILGLVETWLGEEEEFTLTGFKGYFKGKTKKGLRGRKPGGIALMVKEEKGTKSEIIQNKVEECMWVKINIKNEVFIIGVVYNQPSGSVYENKNFFNELKREVDELIERFDKSRLILMGDFNARIGDRIERKRIEGDETVFDEIIEDARWGMILEKRKSRDSVVNRLGKELLEFCKEKDLVVLNGRSLGDQAGEFTCIETVGASVVDYFIVSLTVVGNLKEMRVENRVESDHMPIVLVLNTDVMNEVEVDKKPENKEFRKKVWDKNGLEHWRGNIEEIRKIGINQAIKEGQIEVANRLFCELLDRVCFTYGKMDKRDKNEMNNWFDHECKEFKQLVKRELRTFRRTGRIGDLKKYDEKRKEYRILCNDKKMHGVKSSSKK